RASERSLQWTAALYHLERMVQREPGRADLHERQGAARVELGRWAEAAADFDKATSLGTHRPQSWYRHALLRLFLADPGACLRICAEMLDRFGSAQDADAAQLAAWTCALAPGSEDSTARLVTISRRALADSPKDRSRLLTLGAVLYRAGRNEDAIRTLNES